MPASAQPAVIPGTFNPRPGGAAFNAPVDEAAEHAKNSIKENRVYVGNLSYDVRYKDLEQFMTDGAWDGLRFKNSVSWCDGSALYPSYDSASRSSGNGPKCNRLAATSRRANLRWPSTTWSRLASGPKMASAARLIACSTENCSCKTLCWQPAPSRLGLVGTRRSGWVSGRDRSMSSAEKGTFGLTLCVRGPGPCLLTGRSRSWSRRRLHRDPPHSPGSVEGMRVSPLSTVRGLKGADGLRQSCSIIEFASREDAQRAINEFSDKPLLGRPVFIREVRLGRALHNWLAQQSLIARVSDHTGP